MRKMVLVNALARGLTHNVFVESNEWVQKYTVEYKSLLLTGEYQIHLISTKMSCFVRLS